MLYAFQEVLVLRSKVSLSTSTSLNQVLRPCSTSKFPTSSTISSGDVVVGSTHVETSTDSCEEERVRDEDMGGEGI